MMNDNNNFVNQSVLWGDQNEVGFDVPTFPNSMMKTTTTAADPDQNQEEEEEEEEFIRSQKMWLEKQQSSDHQDHNQLLDLSKASSYYVDDFSPLPVLPVPAADLFATNCMPSSTSFAPPPPPLAVKATTVSSSSTSSDACWPVLITNNNSDLQKLQLMPPAPDAANYYETTSKSNNNNDADAAAVALLLPDSSSSSSVSTTRGWGNNINCLDVMEDFDFMDLQMGFWDSSSSSSPCSIFQGEQRVNNNQEQMKKSVVAEQDSNQQQQDQDQIMQQQKPLIILPADEEEEEEDESSGGGFTGLSYFLQGDRELSDLFMEWVMQHKDCINSSDDIMNMKLKRSTIQKASKRLGNTNQGKKQLLKLILQWVHHNLLVFHNNKKRTLNPAPPPPPPPYLLHQNQNPNSNPGGGGQSANLYCNSIPRLDGNNNINNNNCFTASTNYNWIQSPTTPYAAAPTAYQNQTPAVVPYQIPSSIGYVYDPYCWNKIPSSSSSIVESPPLHMETWSGPSQRQVVNSFWVNTTSVVEEGLNPIHHDDDQVVITSGGNNSSSSSNAAYHQHQVFNENAERRSLLKLGPLATKEARKKRMARHGHKRQHHHTIITNNHQNQVVDHQYHQANYELQNYNSQAAPPPPNLVYNWPQTHPTTTEVHPPPPPPPPPQKEEENNLQFLLQKVLKQSDVGNLGRIVLPKKEAEMHLPELKSRDGIPITIQDIATSNLWTMRYRFWPNNNSRMYLFENTGEFVRANGLQEGDFIVLYSDTKSGKYLIRGIKVRPSETRPAPVVNKKKATKKERNNATRPRSTNDRTSLREIMM